MLEARAGRIGFACLGWAVGVALAAGCAAPPQHPPAPAPRAAAPKPEPPAPLVVAEPALVPLRTGALEPMDHPRVELTVSGRADAGDYEIVSLALPNLQKLYEELELSDPSVNPVEGLSTATVTLEPSVESFAFVEIGRGLVQGEHPPVIWVRRKKSSAPIAGTIFMDANWGDRGHRLPFTATLDKAPRATPKLEQDWATATVTHLDNSASPVWNFAVARLRARYFPKELARAQAAQRGTKRPTDELARLMDTTTGRLSVERALERDRELYLRDARQKPSVPLDKLASPRLSRHPWAEMSARLGTSPPDEPLAHAAPAEFYFVRAEDFGKLMELLDLVDDFGEPAADLLDGQAQARGTLARYEAELGLSRSALTRALGPSVVSTLALVGSDPYVHEGTDLTLIFRVKNAALFDAALAATLARHAASHPNVTESTFTEGGVTVTGRRSADGRVRQLRASAGDLMLVSNSAEAVRRVIATVQGRHPSLADEPDFRYMLARDARTPNDELAYLGDRFIASVVGPAQKIAEARRQIALGELLTPGYAALSLGLIDGKSPQHTSELLRSKLLVAADLKHADGAPIDFEPGGAAHSIWGTPAALEPLLDRPAITRVTAAEQAGYAQFARVYEGIWSERIDPVALRIASETGETDKPALAFDLRVLPTLRSEYWETIRTVGNVHLSVPPLLAGLAGVMSLGEDASLRRELTQSVSVLGLGEKVAFDWLGDYVLLGTTSRNELANLARPFVADKVQRTPTDSERAADHGSLRALENLPVYAAIGVKNRVAAGLFLAAVRAMAREAAPGLMTWTASTAYRGNEVVAVKVADGDVKLTLYYTLTKDALVLALNPEILHLVIDQLADHPPRKEAKGVTGSADSGQFVEELSGDPQGALYRVLAWIVTQSLVEQASTSRKLAESFLLGTKDVDPAASEGLMRAYLGTAVVTPEGKAYTLGPDGVRDPVRGSGVAPIWPELPVAGSPLERVLSRLGRLRTALSFDDEPTAAGTTARPQSSHAHVTLELR